MEDLPALMMRRMRSGPCNARTSIIEEITKAINATAGAASHRPNPNATANTGSNIRGHSPDRQSGMNRLDHAASTYHMTKSNECHTSQPCDSSPTPTTTHGATASILWTSTRKPATVFAQNRNRLSDSIHGTIRPTHTPNAVPTKWDTAAGMANSMAAYPTHTNKPSASNSAITDSATSDATSRTDPHRIRVSAYATRQDARSAARIPAPTPWPNAGPAAGTGMKACARRRPLFAPLASRANSRFNQIMSMAYSVAREAMASSVTP